ncbi:MAG: hypothetical protein OHK0046_19610 [Anaerolineae bacterium]
MHFPILLAHGALGPWDELIFGGVAVTFLVMMGISWFRASQADPLEDNRDLLLGDTPEPADQPDQPERFRLD